MFELKATGLLLLVHEDICTPVRNLGVIFVKDMSLSAHIKQICKTALIHVCNITKIRNVMLKN